MKLKEYRIKSNMTQKEVAKALNITQAGYGNYETGRTEPDINTLINGGRKLFKIISNLSYI